MKRHKHEYKQQPRNKSNPNKKLNQVNKVDILLGVKGHREKMGFKTGFKKSQ